MAPVKLVIFDYSGTLSLESVLFARPDFLMEHLIESGLANLGIADPATFWDEIVNPTWQKGSTTPAGYKKVIRDRISAIHSHKMTDELRDKISDAASFFVDGYLEHSPIDTRWRPILEKLQGRNSVNVMVATDHYAEATGYIIHFLHELQIQAMSAKNAFTVSGYEGVVVACSADLGVHKADPRFWEILKSGLNIDEVRGIVLIDDFGYNEQKGSRYSTGENVEKRKNDTVKMLQMVFSSPVQVVPFMIGNAVSESAFGELITQTSEIIDGYMADSYGG